MWLTVHYVHKISQIPCSNRRLIVNYVYYSSQWTYPGPFTSQKKCNAEVSYTCNSTSTLPIHFHSGVLGKETLWMCVLQLTIKTNYDLQPNTNQRCRDGAWVAESGPRSSVTQSRYSGSDCRLHVSGAVYKVREGQENQGRKTERTNTLRQTQIWNRHIIASVNRKITKRHKAESVGIHRSSAGKTAPLDAKKACGGME
jgi:hypothetical protein